MKTTVEKPAEAKWYVLDAKGKTLGRLATQVAHVLRGKHKPQWSPHQVWSDHVIVLNASEVILQGNKADHKTYFTHSGYFGSAKQIPFARVFKKDPTSVIARAVKGMLPRNKLRREMMDHLHIFKDAEHKHDAQKPADFSTLFPANHSSRPAKKSASSE